MTVLCLLQNQIKSKWTEFRFNLLLFSSTEFSFSRIFNGFDSGLNVTVGNLAYEEITPSNMSEYVEVLNGK